MSRASVFPGTDEFDRFIDDRLDGKGGTATGITIRFRQHHAVEIRSVVERFGGIDGVLTGHGIDHEQDLVRLESPTCPGSRPSSLRRSPGDPRYR